jgi:hypothetical protein
MSEAPISPDAEVQTFILESEDGHSYECEFVNRFEFEGNEYALLLKVSEEGSEAELNEEDQTLVIMRFFVRGNDFVFQTIETDEEFNKVVAYVEETVQAQADEDDEDEE